METTETIKLTLPKETWLVFLDMKDAYLHVPVKLAFRKYLQFSYKGITYKVKALPFDLVPAPWIFTMIVKKVQVRVQTQSFTLHQHFDDWTLKFSSP